MPLKYRMYIGLGLIAPHTAVGIYESWLFGSIDLRLGATMLGMTLAAVLAIVFAARFMPTITITADRTGFYWSRWWRLPWGDVTAAQVRSLFGVRWIVIHRRKGFRWSVWWSLPGSPDFIVQVLRFVPEDNPLHNCVRAHLSQRSPV